MMNEPKSITFIEIIEEYNQILDETGKLNYLVRAAELQKEQVEKLKSFKDNIKSFKLQAIQRDDEDKANLFFHFQCILNSHISILEMWIKLKAEDYVEAWFSLVDAQEYVVVALRASKNHHGVDHYINNLKMIEDVIFPGWPLYNSTGLIETSGNCSICGTQYDNCDHIEGFVYKGRLCQRVNRKPISVEHSALVQHPRDKRCIITKISTDDGKKRDYITWRVLDESVEISPNSLGTFEGVILSTRQLDFD